MSHDPSSEHEGHHDHDHAHGEASPEALRTEALESLLVEKGLVDTESIDRIVAHYEQDVGPMNGARMVARAWVDTGFRERLLADGTAAAAEMAFGDAEAAYLVFVENTPTRFYEIRPYRNEESRLYRF